MFVYEKGERYDKRVCIYDMFRSRREEACEIFIQLTNRFVLKIGLPSFFFMSLILAITFVLGYSLISCVFTNAKVTKKFIVRLKKNSSCRLYTITVQYKIED